MPSHPKPVGGHILAHFSTTRIMLRKGRAEQRIAPLALKRPLPQAVLDHASDVAAQENLRFALLARERERV